MDVRSHLEIDMSALPHEVYDLIVTITDQVSGQTTNAVLTFRTLPIVQIRNRTGYPFRRISPTSSALYQSVEYEPWQLFS